MFALRYCQVLRKACEPGLHTGWLMLCRNLFTATGIDACSYNMNVAGIYTIAFAVTNSQGLSASVNRTLVVMPI